MPGAADSRLPAGAAARGRQPAVNTRSAVARQNPIRRVSTFHDLPNLSLDAAPVGLIDLEDSHTAHGVRRFVLALSLPIAVAALLVSAPLSAQERSAKAQDGFSLGLILGDPTGITLRGGVREHGAIQAHFGFGAKAMWFASREFAWEHNHRKSFADYSQVLLMPG